jgi:flagellar hook assembly protein FlgD
VTLAVYDAQGKLVRQLANTEMDGGFKSFTWDGRDGLGVAVGSGVYFCRLNAGKQHLTQKMVLVK